MVNENFGIYLNDHCAGARFAVELLQRIGADHAGEPLGDFALALLEQIEGDYEILKAIADEHEAAGGLIKEAVGWIGEKASRVKLQLSSNSPIGDFESLELLSLGILGKLKLWEVLKVLRNEVSYLHTKGIDIDQLIASAQEQHDKVESQRRTLITFTFSSPVAGDSRDSS